jgi:transcriptional regulator TrmB
MPHDSKRWSKESPRKSRPKDRRPHLFGRGGRDRVLICLAVNGPMHVRHIARVIGSPSGKVFDMVEGLRETGLVVKRQRAGGRKYVALNQKLPAYRALNRLLLALDRYWPIGRVEKAARWSWHMPFENNMSERLFNEIFHSSVRSRTLLFVAAVGTVDLMTISNTLDLSVTSTLQALGRWEREGILRFQRVRTRWLIALDTNFEAATELRSFLLELVKNSSEHRALRKIGREKMHRLKRTD